ncbi:M4 family metallopeptidase [Nocardioides sp. cx-169]|uniref:M4 family metallopeptidase n=1 Tax=Nocardioides sp. cx-169 TaxID=2899080 RepID=UPI001E626AAB|nr:M4 family metallopeptidase [Nocardioides sp. cx-169]MCD4535579.1 M4 family metallopeptidase [Nocardioides sp. cx-169]
MKLLKTGLSLVLLGGGLAALPAAQATATPSAPGAPDSLVQKMRNEASGAVKITQDRATGKIAFIRASGGSADLLPDVDGRSSGAAAAKARSYLDDYAPAFGATAAQLTQSGVTAGDYGWTVDFDQSYRGVPVFGAKVRAHLDRQGDLTSVNGYAAPGLKLDTTPTLSAEEAATRAVAIVRAKSSTPDARVAKTGLKAKNTDLMIYRMGSARGVTGAPVLTYVVEVTNKTTVRDMVFLDARTGKIVNRYSMMNDALDRRLYEASVDDNGTPSDPSDDETVYTLKYKEGDPLPGTLNTDQLNEVEGTGEAYWFFRNAFGRDSYDGAGARMITVNNEPSINCPNANWNGATTNYCSGVSSDDTVAHEWGHAYTEYTSGLIYQWQSGAMNEAFSDIWGENVDALNNRYNEEPDTRRSDDPSVCSKYTRGAVGLTINSPADIAGACDAAPAAFGPVFDKTGVTSDVVVGAPLDGCAPFTNAGAIAGKFVYVDRGTCTFGAKANAAEAAGAEGIIIGNNVAGEAPFSPSGQADIYGVMIGQADGAKIKGAAGTVNVTIKDIDEAAKDDSYRWLSGEADPAFGGAIRDMWNPTCYGDPGKVSDAEYKCSEDDHGGVHSNSGVVNHSYALLVDGGTYNGVTVPGIGRDKASAIYWRTQSEYLFPVADFTDLADGLAASCTDLVGQEIKQLTLEPNATPAAATPITAADCTSVALMTDAVELRRDPTQQCEFKPLLEKGAPSQCGKNFVSRASYSEDFEDGLAGWTKSEEVVFEGASGIPWEAKSAAPGSHPSKVAYAPDPPEAGDCQFGADDVSSRNSITSPVIKVPAGSSPTLSFEHYVATEYGFDGGNVKISVGGGAFKVIPASAYLFNAPGATLEPKPDNTSPLAGEVGFTGTDGGENRGSWGKSIVDLKKAGAKRDQQVRIRFDMGRDGCGGLDGWYVDNVKVVNCKNKTALNAQARPNGRVAARLKVIGSSAKPTTMVRLVKNGRFVGKGVVRKGFGIISVRGLKPGRHRIEVRFGGSDALAASRDTVTIWVKKR